MHSISYLDSHDVIYKMRRAGGINQKTFAKNVGIDLKRFSAIERGSRSVSKEEILRISEELKVDGLENALDPFVSDVTTAIRGRQAA